MLKVVIAMAVLTVLSISNVGLLAGILGYSGQFFLFAVRHIGMKVGYRYPLVAEAVITIAFILVLLGFFETFDWKGILFGLLVRAIFYGIWVYEDDQIVYPEEFEED